MDHHIQRQFLILLLISLLTSACGLVANPTPLPAGFVQTSVAQTLEAEQIFFIPTNTPAPASSATPTETATPWIMPTYTATDTKVPVPSLTPWSIKTQTSAAATSSIVKPDIGYTAPDFTLEEAGTGQSLSLSQFRGQPVIVIFWVTWCPYCAKSLPLIQAAYDRHRAEGLVVLAVDAQESEKKVRKAAQNMGLTFNLLLDSRGKVQNLYDVIAYPWTFFIDRNGVIHGEHRGSVSQQVLDQNLPGILK